MGDNIRAATPGGTKVLFARLLEVSVIPYANKIATIWMSGGIAVVGFELSEKGRDEARFLGWDGMTFPFRMPDETIRSMMIGSEFRDVVTMNWLNRRSERVFVIVHDGATCLLNHNKSRWELEPKSTNVGWMS